MDQQQPEAECAACDLAQRGSPTCRITARNRGSDAIVLKAGYCSTMANSTAWSSQARCTAATAASLLAQRVVDQRDAERRDVLVPPVRIELLQHRPRIARPARRGVRRSQDRPRSSNCVHAPVARQSRARGSRRPSGPSPRTSRRAGNARGCCLGSFRAHGRNSASARSCWPAARYAAPTAICALIERGSSLRPRSAAAMASVESSTPHQRERSSPWWTHRDRSADRRRAASSFALSSQRQW